jgi:hypothetical protein
MSTDLIPRDLAQGFRDAVEFYRSSWSPAVHGREVSINGRAFTISAVCSLVAGFTDQLPEDVQHDLLDCLDISHADLKNVLAQHPTYAAGSRCLLKVMQDREASYHRGDDD